MPRRKTDTDPANPPALTFEQAIEGLEALVETMEHGDLPLHELVDHYEKGSELLKLCDTILSSARTRIETITLRNSDEIALESSADPSQTAGPPQPTTDPTDDPDDDDDIRLF
jgi:exodeoxyribonuclease VII small subunit